MELSELSDGQLLTEAIEAIQNGAEGEAQGGDEVSYGRALEFLAESVRRLIAAGHSRRCRSGIYHRAYEIVTARHSHGQPVEPIELVCSCGAADA